jgi:DNA-binding CsgD family transcriptional regulator
MSVALVASVAEVDEPSLATALELINPEISISLSTAVPGLAPAPPARRTVAPARPRGFAHLVSAWREGLLDAFDHVGSGAILVGPRGQVLNINVTGRRHLGSGIAVVRGRLVAIDRSSDNALQGLLRAMSAQPSGAGSGIALLRRDSQPLLAYSVPIDSMDAQFNGAIGLLLLVDPQERREPAAALLRQVFGLTPAEARLAAGLAKGLDLTEISELHAVSVGTLRVQLKSIFAKTQTKRQAQLVVLLARLSL